MKKLDISVEDMLAKSPDELRGPDPRPPHPASLSGPLVDFCKLPAEVQIWKHEEAGFERRLTVEVRRRREQGATVEELEDFVKKHRRRWRTMRDRKKPEAVRKHERGPYAEFDDRFDASSSLRWEDG